jgi:hypothetical protein
MLRRVAVVRIASIIRVIRVGEQGTMVAVTSNRSTLPILVTMMMEVICSSETSVFTTATWSNISEFGILHIHHRENLQSYLALTGWVL